MKLKIAGILGALALALFSPSQLATAAAPEANLTYVDCWFETSEGANVFCGWLQAPENRADGNNNRVVRMPVVMLEGIASGHGPFAVVLGGGGPGGGLGLESAEGIEYWDNYRRETLGDAGNLVLMDQRGAGMSKPFLGCPDSDISDEEYLSSIITLEDDLRISRQESESCVSKFTDWGVDLSAYTTSASADDYEDLRRMMRGKKWWHIIGSSYGTRLAFELIRRHPDGVGAVVMNGIAPPESSDLPPHDSSASALMKIANACDEDDFCRTNYGDLRVNLKSAANILEQAPIAVTVPHPYNDGDVTVAINPNRLANIISSGMYGELGVALMPCVASELSGGQECQFVMNGGQISGLDWLVYQYAEELLETGFADALLSAISCRERGSPHLTDNTEDFPFDLWSEWTKRSESVCNDIWAKEGKTPEAQVPVATEKPILMLSGFFDPATPPEWAAAAAKRLPKAIVYQFPSSHYGEGQQECQEYLTLQFLENPFGEISDSCVERAKSMRFH